jgi:hypothetical protein
MGYPHHPHVQSSAMGGSLEPKFPPSEEYHHYNGYSMAAAGMAQTSPGDYFHHQSNGIHQNLANFSYSQGFGIVSNIIIITIIRLAVVLGHLQPGADWLAKFWWDFFKGAPKKKITAKTKLLT